MVDTMGPEKVIRSKHSKEFKDELVHACSTPGTSVAGVALANGVNANLLRKWMHARGVAAPDSRARSLPTATTRIASEFMPVMITPSAPAMAEIRIEARRGTAVVKVEWPVSAAGECAAWLRDWLK